MGAETAFGELPLALFSTLAPMGAGAFALLAAAFCTGGVPADKARRLDWLTLVPIAFVLVGFTCAFFHLASPLRAFGVFSHVGSSPLSNEILVGVLFCVVMGAYWLVALLAKPGAALRKGLVLAAAVAGLVFCAFVGLAYGMSTIISWDSPFVPLSIIGFGLVGGAAVGTVTLSAAKVDTAPFSMVALALLWAGLVLGLGCFGAHLGTVSSLANNVMQGSALVSAMLLFAVAAAVAQVVSAGLTTVALRRGGSTGLAGVSVAVAFMGILMARLAFYGVQLSVGLGM